jgi:hypothetical protein
MSSAMGIGRIKLSDSTILNLKICIIDVKEVGYSPFEGINFDVKTIGGVAVEYITDEVKRSVADKPLMPFEPPREGWESLEIVEQQPAIAEVEVQVSRGVFVVKVVAEAVMAARNLQYRNTYNEPIYWISWVYKTSWRAKK